MGDVVAVAASLVFHPEPPQDFPPAFFFFRPLMGVTRLHSLRAENRLDSGVEFERVPLDALSS